MKVHLEMTHVYGVGAYGIGTEASLWLCEDTGKRHPLHTATRIKARVTCKHCLRYIGKWKKK